MIQAARLPSLLFDPRGRISRTGLLVSATAMLALEAALIPFSPDDGSIPMLLWPAKAVVWWVGGAAIVKRLHDIGRSGWWLGAGAAAMCMWAAVLGIGLSIVGGLPAMQPGSVGYVLLLAALMIPAIGITLWLHLAVGEPGMNRYGPEPDNVFDARPEQAPEESEPAAAGR